MDWKKKLKPWERERLKREEKEYREKVKKAEKFFASLKNKKKVRAMNFFIDVMEELNRIDKLERLNSQEGVKTKSKPRTRLKKMIL